MVLLFLTAFVLLVLNTICSLGNMGIDLFKKLKQHSHEFITPSNLNTFLMPKTVSTCSHVSQILMYISQNL